MAARMRSRRSIRLSEYDYAQDGVYFVTICTQGRECLLGKVNEGRVELTEYGQIVQEEWSRSTSIREELSLGEFVIMPNHVHGLLAFEGQRRGVQLNAPTVRHLTRRHSVISPRPGTLPVLVRTYKAAVTTQCRRAGFSDFGWQRKYYDHIVRDEDDLSRVRQYIVDNPLQWELDEYHPAQTAANA